MARRKLTDKLIHKSEINEEMKLIAESDTDYITPSGNVYVDYGNDQFFPKTTFINKANGYMYVNINTPSGFKQRRVHRLVALAFIDNPEQLTVVGHKDNNKANCHVSNLYWTTISQNTQKAVDDGLLVNASGYEDSQSIAVCVFDMSHNLIAQYGSIREAAKAVGVTAGGIRYQCEHNVRTKPRCGYYFRYQDEYEEKGFVL